jgi:predicted dehydrogenase
MRITIGMPVNGPMNYGAPITRRSFVRYAGYNAAAAAAFRPAWARVIGANDRINVAIIGLGLRGNDHLGLLLQHLQNKSDIEIVSLCDVYQKRLNMAARMVPAAKTYTHHEDVLQRPDIDAVFIATPDHWHAPMTLMAMENGKDVYVEKPMTHTVEESKEVAHQAKQLNRVVQVGVQGLSWNRWHRIRKIIHSGMIGQVVAVQGTYSRNNPQGDWNWPIDPVAGPEATGDDHIDWKQWLGLAPQIPFNSDRFFRFRKYWDYSGGIATDLHYHVLAPFHLAVANDFPTRVAGMGGDWVYNDGRETPDTFLTAADYPGKYSITIQSSQVNENGPTIMVRGTKATIHLSDEWEGPPTRQYEYADIIPESSYVAEFSKQFGNEIVRVHNVGNQGDLLHIDNFLDCVRSRQQPNCPVDLGYKVMATIDLSVRSYRNGVVYYFDAENERVYEKGNA